MNQKKKMQNQSGPRWTAAGTLYPGSTRVTRELGSAGPHRKERLRQIQGLRRASPSTGARVAP